MFGTPLRVAFVLRQCAFVAAAALLSLAAQLPSGTASAHGLAASMLGAAVIDPEQASPAKMFTAELRRHRARPARYRMTPAERARAVRIARIMRVYRAARMARLRIPVAKRVARASAELARAERRGDQYCLATAIYHESRLEPLRGQRAVAEVIMARTRVPGRPRSICGVVYEGAWRATGCQFSFTCDGLSDRAKYPEDWSEANSVAASVLAARGGKRYARGATFYHASYVRPRWSKRMVRVAKIGAHIFYRPRRGRLL